jgi:hypothetical protein
MDRAHLDTAYNNLAAVTSSAKLLADWAARSASFREKHRGHLGLAYGERPRDLAEGAVSHGLNVAVVEYTLAPEARMDRIVGEVRHAISWLHEHLGDYGADSGRIYVAGHSAGGHLTAMTMPLGEVRGGIAISGVYDLEPVRLNYLNEKLGLDEAEAQRNSPMLNFPPMAGPLIVTYGTAELPELCRQSIDYAQTWVGRGLPGRLLPIGWADHFTILETLAQPDGELMEALLNLCERRGVYGVVRLMAKHGDARPTDLRSFLTADWPKRAKRSIDAQCEAKFDPPPETRRERPAW